MPTTDGQVTVALIKSDPPPQRFGVFRDEDLLGVVLAAAYADVAAVLDSGLEFRADIAEGRLTLSLPADAAEAP